MKAVPVDPPMAWTVTCDVNISGVKHDVEFSQWVEVTEDLLHHRPAFEVKARLHSATPQVPGTSYPTWPMWGAAAFLALGAWSAFLSVWRMSAACILGILVCLWGIRLSGKIPWEDAWSRVNPGAIISIPQQILDFAEPEEISRLLESPDLQRSALQLIGTMQTARVLSNQIRDEDSDWLNQRIAATVQDFELVKSDRGR